MNYRIIVCREFSFDLMIASMMHFTSQVISHFASRAFMQKLSDARESGVEGARRRRMKTKELKIMGRNFLFIHTRVVCGWQKGKKSSEDNANFA